jgi:lariat debranching enzyme
MDRGYSHDGSSGPNQYGNYRGRGRRSGRGWTQRDGNSNQRNMTGQGRFVQRGSPQQQNNRFGSRGRIGGRHRNNNSNGNNNWSTQNHDVSLDIIEQIGNQSQHTISIAIEGCCHGELDRIYERIAKHEEQTGQKIELLLCCGDFQSLRHPVDFHALSCPPKYRNLGTFYQYYSGVKVAPILTIFIGGNHESSQSLRELCYGGWVAPKIYYLGAAGVVRYKGLRIGGISGIYKSHDYCLSRYETPPYDPRALRSVYHVRNVDVYRLKCLEVNPDCDRLDVMLSHDWPQGIEQHGDTQSLLRKKPFFRQEIQENSLGSPPNRELLNQLKPRYWFAAHLHVKFKATVDHSNTGREGRSMSRDTKQPLIPSQVITQSSSSISQDKAISDASEATTEMSTSKTEFIAIETSTACIEKSDLTTQMTEFLSLDKCLPRRQYLSILHIPMSTEVDYTGNDAPLEYDTEWLAILRKTHLLDSTTENHRVNINRAPEIVTKEEMDTIKTLMLESMIIPTNFTPTVPPFFSSSNEASPNNLPKPLPLMGNPQMDTLLDKLQLEHVTTIPWDADTTSMIETVPLHVPRNATRIDPVFTLQDNEQEAQSIVRDQNEIDLDDNDEEIEDHGLLSNHPDTDARNQNEFDLKDNSVRDSNVNPNDDTRNDIIEQAGEEVGDTNKKPRISETG